MAVLTNEKIIAPVVIAEGRIMEIDLGSFGEVYFAELIPGEPGPVEVRIVGNSDFYINIFDHRTLVTEAFRRCGYCDDFLKIFYNDVPCLGGFRRKGQTLYAVLADIGTPDIKDESKNLVLCHVGDFDKTQYRVAGGGQTIHQATGLCLIEPRPPKPEKEAG